jgi:hypothetical protein
VIVLAGLVLSALVMALALKLGGSSTELVWGSLAGAIVWTAVIFPVGVGISAIAGRFDTALLFTFYWISAAQEVFLFGPEFPDFVSRGLVWMLIPVNPIFLIWGGFVGQGWAVVGSDFARLIAYPLIFLLIAWTRLRSKSLEVE